MNVIVRHVWRTTGHLTLYSGWRPAIACSFPGWSAPNHASKFALEAFSEMLGMEVAGSGVHVSIVEPGFFKTGIGGNARSRSDVRVATEIRRTAELKKPTGEQGGTLGLHRSGVNAMNKGVIDGLPPAAGGRSDRPCQQEVDE